MSTAILTVIIAYSAVSLWFGLLTQKRSLNTSEDYFIASRSVTWVHLGLTIFATWFSTFAFLGAPGFALTKGTTWTSMMGVFGIGSVFLMWFIGRKLWLAGQKNNYITPADLLADFYGGATIRFLVAIISIVALIPYCLIQLVGIGKVIDASTGGEVPYWVAVVLTGFVTAFYTFTGGIRAIVWTDIIQGVLFSLVILLGAATAIYVCGGIGAGYELAIANYPERFVLDPSNIGNAVTMMVIWSFGFVLLPHLWQRTYMADSASTFSKAIVLHACLAFAVIVMINVMGTLGMAFVGEIGDSDKYVPWLYSEYIPWALPLLALATFAAGMSTIDSQLLTASSVFVRDLVNPVFGGKLGTAGERRLGKLFVVFLIAFLTVLALMPAAQGPIIALASKGVGLVLLLIIPLAGPLMWSGATRAGAISGLIVGLIVFTVFEAGIMPISLPLGFGASIFATLIGGAVFVCISYFSKCATETGTAIRSTSVTAR